MTTKIADAVLQHDVFRANVALPLRYETFDGRRHLVAPVVAMVEGVHSGSGGSMYYPAAELSAFVDAWNGVPLPVQHPVDDGAPVTANQPSIIDSQVVGRFFNVYFDMDKQGICGEVWIDVDKAARIAPNMLSQLKIGRPLEVSTGLYSEADDTPGTWRGEDYVGTVHNIRPDHLALLPGGKGACSWEDGCGVRANEASHEETRMALQQKINALDNESWLHFLREVYDDTFVYEAMGSNPSEGSSGVSKLYRQGYTIDDNEVTITGEPEEVQEERQYVPVDNNSNPTNEEVTMDRVKIITDLIANEKTPWVCGDKEMLESMTDEQLTKLTAINDEPEEVPAEGDIDGKELPPVKPELDPEVPEGDVDKPEPPVKNAEEQEALDRAVAIHRERKTGLVTQLVANKRCTFTEAELNEKSLADLEKLATLAEINVDYSGRAGAPATNKDDNAVPAPAKLWEL